MPLAQWPVHDAKARFSQLLRDASSEGPQVVTRHGRPAAVVLSVEEFRQHEARRQSLAEVIRSSPMAGVEIDLDRSQSGPRDVDLSEVGPWAI